MDKRIQELLEQAQADNITLPFPLEDKGCVVDLHTGAILIGEADRSYTWEWTPYGEAIAHLLLRGMEI
jgi:hypothetical protein